MYHHLLSESSALVLDYDLVNNILHARWGPEQTLATTQAGYEEILRALPPLLCHLLLDDRRHSHLMWEELAGWMATDWYPRAHQAGLRRHAVVFATNFFGHRSTELVLARVHDGELIGFDSEAAARHMLLAP